MPPTSSNNQSTSLPGPLTIEALLAAGAAQGDAKSAAGLQSYTVVPEGYTLKLIPFAELPPLPGHIRQRVTLGDPESFVVYVKRYGNANMVIFAKPPGANGAGALFEAVFDYHHAEKDGVANPEMTQANRTAHRASYPCPMALPWALWTGVSGREQSQAEFIEFIHQNVPEIVSPASATILELARNFESTTNVEFSSKKDTVTGGIQLTYKEVVDAGGGNAGGGKIKCFDKMQLMMPVFEGGEEYPIAADVLWKPRDGKLKVTLTLYRPGEVVREAFANLREAVAEQTGTEPMTGSMVENSGQQF